MISCRQILHLRVNVVLDCLKMNLKNKICSNWHGKPVFCPLRPLFSGLRWWLQCKEERETLWVLGCRSFYRFSKCCAHTLLFCFIWQNVECSPTLEEWKCSFWLRGELNRCQENWSFVNKGEIENECWARDSLMCPSPDSLKLSVFYWNWECCKPWATDAFLSPKC